MLITFSALLFGLLRGIGHALEPDHLAAVSTLVAESKGAPRAGLLLGAAWGAGHTLTLLVVGGALFLFRAEMPARVETMMELGVALMLVMLGARALTRAARDSGSGGDERRAAAAHSHGATEHAHAGPVEHVHLRRWTLARRPLLVGLMHGLAGSGALTAAVLAELPSPASGVLYMALFGIGSSAGMALLSGVAGMPLARLARSPRALPLMLGASGVLSLGLGLAWGFIHASKLL